MNSVAILVLKAKKTSASTPSRQQRLGLRGLGYRGPYGPCALILRRLARRHACDRDHGSPRQHTRGLVILIGADRVVAVLELDLLLHAPLALVVDIELGEWVIVKKQIEHGPGGRGSSQGHLAPRIPGGPLVDRGEPNGRLVTRRLAR